VFWHWQGDSRLFWAKGTGDKHEGSAMPISRKLWTYAEVTIDRIYGDGIFKRAYIVSVCDERRYV